MSVNGSNKSVSSWIASVHHSATLSLVVLVCGIILAGVVYEIIDHWETRAREAEFEQRAGVYAETLQRKLRRQGATISMVATLFKIYDDVPSERFRDFVREPLDKHSELKFFEWIVFIPSDQQNKDETAGSRAENEDTEKPNGKIRSLDRHPPADRADDGEQQVLSEDYKDFLQNTWGENVGDEEEASGAVVHTETGSREYSVVVPIFERGGMRLPPP